MRSTTPKTTTRRFSLCAVSPCEFVSPFDATGSTSYGNSLPRFGLSFFYHCIAFFSFFLSILTRVDNCFPLALSDSFHCSTISRRGGPIVVAARGGNDFIPACWSCRRSDPRARICCWKGFERSALGCLVVGIQANREAVKKLLWFDCTSNQDICHWGLVFVLGLWPGGPLIEEHWTLRQLASIQFCSQ